MPRLNIKSTKAAFVEELKDLEHKAISYGEKHPGKSTNHFYVAQWALLAVAKKLEIHIGLSEFSDNPVKPEDYK